MSLTGFNLQRRRRAKLNAEKEKEVQEEKKEEVIDEETRLRNLGKQHKIKSYHNMKIETLKERLAEYGVD